MMNREESTAKVHTFHCDRVDCKNTIEVDAALRLGSQPWMLVIWNASTPDRRHLHFCLTCKVELEKFITPAKPKAPWVKQ